MNFFIFLGVFGISNKRITKIIRKRTKNCTKREADHNEAPEATCQGK